MAMEFAQIESLEYTTLGNDIRYSSVNIEGENPPPQDANIELPDAWKNQDTWCNSP